MAILDPRRFQNRNDPLKKKTGGKAAVPEISNSPTLKTSKAVQDGLRGAFTQPEATAPATQHVTGSGYNAGLAPEPTMYGAAHRKNSLDPRHVLPDSILGSMANLFEVSFVGFPFTQIGTLLFRDEELGLLCSEASLPATSFGTLEVNGHYQGRTEVFAHTRIYPSLTLSFYETLDHKSLMFFEGWQRHITADDIISCPENAESANNYYYRMRFPEDYKCDTIFITKFEKNYSGSGYADTLTYQFIQAFPKNVTSVPVAYGQSEFTKVTVEFAYDRYIVNPRKRKAETKPDYAPDAPSQELVREDLAIHALTNRAMIESVGTDAQRRILADADSRYPPGSPAREALRQAALSGTYAAPDPTGQIVRQPERKVPADAINKINDGFGIQSEATPTPTIQSKPPETETPQPTSRTIPAPRTPSNDLSGWKKYGFMDPNPNAPVLTPEQRRAERVERLGEDKVREIEAKSAAMYAAGAE